jgi:hypothetical protein
MQPTKTLRVFVRTPRIGLLAALLARSGSPRCSLAHASNPSGILGAVGVLHWTLTNVIVESCRRGTADLPLAGAGW